MRLSDLIIAGVPKSFDVNYSPEIVQPLPDDADPEDILYDMYPAECDESTLSVHLSPWASEADVLLYVALVNALLRKHKRARLYDKYAPLKCLTDEDAARMIKDRRAYLKRQLTTKESFTMEGLNADFTLTVAHLRPAVSPDIQALELQRQFVSMQWDFPDA